MNKNENMALIFNKLSKDSQRYLLNMAIVAKVAEESVVKNITHNNETLKQKGA